MASRLDLMATVDAEDEVERSMVGSVLPKVELAASGDTIEAVLEVVGVAVREGVVLTEMEGVADCEDVGLTEIVGLAVREGVGLTEIVGVGLTEMEGVAEGVTLLGVALTDVEGVGDGDGHTLMAEVTWLVALPP